MNNLSTTSKLLMLGIILVQIFDAIIHMATDQLEPLRIASNVVMILWVMVAWLQWLKNQRRSVAVAAIVIYLFLNLIFLVQNGLFNPLQDNAPRTMLFLLVTITIILSGWVAARIGRIQN